MGWEGARGCIEDQLRIWLVTNWEWQRKELLQVGGGVVVGGRCNRLFF